ncbi:putative transporter, basic amino acid/polyamine antiporter [Burkholderia thailandensis E264]|uniref:Amino acid permease n=1 Tax=Burkholderia thailandensis (strain ATCC 700388 / DSM 13276 / CCUG 48851 / CIP 106301 / E264) TaxID=271848 RepID=Q2T5Q3_BURTA|nr:amino acid permease [Burkholderia thailandensis E264]AHI74916.1 putative transporter, basic amino acid/polyamine antiporter [Burkholderia thailandensis 2002721723]AJY01386.1 putative transporter, basic amino acid/polyamine antiporter [Burkholderia thailandensis 2002721643]NBC89952.1 amino acid permease [Burkholderia thailandensis]AIP27839.1 putative transporter, basic amino acid/polyamine antiporter [Burkholderia thailandensis E264]
MLAGARAASGQGERGQHRHAAHEEDPRDVRRGPRARRPASVATVYCCWLLYAAGPKYLLLSALLYAPGALLYAWAKRERGERPFKPFEAAILIALVAFAALAGWLVAAGRISL